MKREEIMTLNSPKYRSIKIKNKMWNDIGRELNQPGTGEAVKQKWKGLRDYHRAEIKKLKKAAEAHQSTWPLFSMMSFLNDVMTTRKRWSNLSPVNRKTTEPVVNYPQCELQQDTGRGGDNESINSDSSHAEYTPECTFQLEKADCGNIASGTGLLYGKTISNEIPSQTNIAGKKKAKKRKPENNFQDKMLQLEMKKVALLEKEMEESDEDLLFFKSFLPDLKSLPRKRKVFLKSKFQEMLYHEISASERCPSPITSQQSVMPFVQPTTTTQLPQNQWTADTHNLNNIH